MKALDALIGERSAEEVAQLRAIAARLQERALLDLGFAMLVERYREADPARVAPTMGFA